MNYIKTWKEVMLRPSDFFRRMPTTGGYNDPIIFALISIVLSVLFFVLFRHGMFIFGVQSSILKLGIMHGPIFNFLTYSNIIKPFAIGIQCSFIMAQAFNLVSKALGGTGSYEGTIRFLSYATAVQILSWIPLIGLIVWIYGLYLNIVGGSFVHKVSMGKSAIAILLPVVILIIIFIVAGIAILGAIISGFSNSFSTG